MVDTQQAQEKKEIELRTVVDSITIVAKKKEERLRDLWLETTIENTKVELQYSDEIDSKEDLLKLERALFDLVSSFSSNSLQKTVENIAKRVLEEIKKADEIVITVTAARDEDEVTVAYIEAYYKEHMIYKSKIKAEYAKKVNATIVDDITRYTRAFNF